MILILYVDDLLVCGPDEKEVDQVFKDLINNGFELTMEEEAGENAFHFLGIELNFNGDSIKLTQHGLIRKLLELVDMEDCKQASTPANLVPLGTDAEGNPFQRKVEICISCRNDDVPSCKCIPRDSICCTSMC